MNSGAPKGEAVPSPLALYTNSIQIHYNLDDSLMTMFSAHVLENRIQIAIVNWPLTDFFEDIRNSSYSKVRFFGGTLSERCGSIEENKNWSTMLTARLNVFM